VTLIVEFGSNIVNTTFRKITNFVHLTTITMVHYDLIIITAIRKIINHYFGNTRMKNIVMFILFSILILFLTGTVTFSYKNHLLFIILSHFLNINFIF